MHSNPNKNFYFKLAAAFLLEMDSKRGSGDVFYKRKPTVCFEFALNLIKKWDAR